MGPGGGDLRVLLFASLRERAGWGERLIRLPLEPGTTPARIWTELGLEACQPGATGIRIAINQRFASADQPLRPGDELAFLPPISGG
ncbi:MULTISPECIES: MoaD/ThiS family protein [Aphanothece]|uniref:MoaD/ThiS family protein n=1 Tax=Aphanothece TaxID=1121 RepID=UPI00398F23D2